MLNGLSYFRFRLLLDELDAFRIVGLQVINTIAVCIQMKHIAVLNRKGFHQLS